MKPKNPLLGSWVCERGGAAEVYQTKKLGRHFYTSCGCCGLNQGTGAVRQQKIFDEAKFIDSSVVVTPSNVTAGKAEKVVSTVPTELEKPADKNSGAKDFDPSEPVPQSVGQQEESKPFPTGKFIAGVAFMLAAGAGIWLN